MFAEQRYFLFIQESSAKDQFSSALSETQEQMLLAVEEQQLLKMAAVKQCDSEVDDLRRRCEDYNRVRL